MTNSSRDNAGGDDNCQGRPQQSGTEDVIIMPQEEGKRDFEDATADDDAVDLQRRTGPQQSPAPAMCCPPDRRGGHSIQELAFLDLKYEVDIVRPGMESKALTVLDGVSGQANSKEMLALMGPSGSGKTSLLNVLAQRVPPKSVSGGVFVDGSPMSKSFKRRMGFVFQDDMCLYNLTVRETVMFASKLRLPQTTPDQEKIHRVEELLELLGLSSVADSVIGKEGKRGISGGERKRVSIGVELITNPDVLFLDEPTSGLDSSTALSIAMLLRGLTKKGMIVVCSIHQPRSNIFSEFDKVLLLSKGNTIYYGGRGSVINYFHTLGLEVPPETNPADWILDMTTSSQTPRGGETLVDAYKQRKAKPFSPDMAIPTASAIAETQHRLTGSGSDKSSWGTSFWFQIKVLLERESKQSRGEVFNAVHLGQTLILAIIASGLWWQSDNVADKAGAMFFISMQQSVIGLQTSMRVFPPERGVMIRERSTGSYRVGAYFLAKSTSDVASFTPAPLVLGTIVYWSIGLRPEAGAFFAFLCLFLGQVIVGQSIGLLISTAIADIFTAKSFSFVLTLGLMLFGGFYVNGENIPEELRWLKYVSFMFYGFGGLLYNELHGRTFACAEVSGRSLLGLKECTQNGSGIVTGQDILKAYGFPDVNMWGNIAVLAVIIFGLRLLTYFSMRRFTKTRV